MFTLENWLTLRALIIRFSHTHTNTFEKAEGLGPRTVHALRTAAPVLAASIE